MGNRNTKIIKKPNKAAEKARKESILERMNVAYSNLKNELNTLKNSSNYTAILYIYYKLSEVICKEFYASKPTSKPPFSA